MGGHVTVVSLSAVDREDLGAEARARGCCVSCNRPPPKPKAFRGQVSVLEFSLDYCIVSRDPLLWCKVTNNAYARIRMRISGVPSLLTTLYCSLYQTKERLYVSVYNAWLVA